MPKIEFHKASSTFLLTSDSGEVVPYRYYPNSKNVWEGLKEEDFLVFILNNPFIHRELDFFEIKFDDSDERGGFLFPIALLESEEVDKRQLLSYMLVAYKTLLLRVKGNLTGVLSDNYKDAFVLVVHKATKPDFIFADYQLSLARNGFYVYQGEIKSRFPNVPTIQNHAKTIRLSKREKDNTDIGYVKELIDSRLCSASDFLTRFILVYQVIELYISEIQDKLLDDAIDRYKKGEISRNDFGEEIKNKSREGHQIACLMEDLDKEDECMDYKREVLSLFNDIDYKTNTESISTLLYALRNQIFHNYKKFVGHEDALAQTIFSFERVVLKVLSKRLVAEKL